MNGETKLNIPLMENNVTAEDIDELIAFLKGLPRLTQAENVGKFEKEWSDWLGVRHSVFVNSGSAANLATMSALRQLRGTGEIITPTLAWISDIMSVLINGFRPVFVDINPRNLCMNEEQIISCINAKTKAVFLTHVQGFNGLSDRLLAELAERGIPLIEDVCESHGATFRSKKLGSFGFISNFSFYFGHHMTTIEGGMVCTDDREAYETVRMFRSHGMVREVTDDSMRNEYEAKHRDLSPDFIFAVPGFNLRNTEIGAVLGRSQLRRLDGNNEKRQRNFELFLRYLDADKYRTDFDVDGNCNYAFNLIMRKADPVFRDKLEAALRDNNVEFRRGSSGGGNQLRQPYLANRLPDVDPAKYPEVEHVHFYGYYIGNYPDLEQEKIRKLCELVNGID
jgi:CDP-6-deoxy-D-xylo-4-hexulose-3-dehydrase